jgi:hypothetical protein
VIANRILQAAPEPRDGVVVLATPKWLRVGFRASLLLCGLALIFLSLMSPSPLPTPWAAFGLIVGVLTLAAAVWPGPWNRFELFVATQEGVAFPANDQLVVSLGGSEDRRWLLVPWANIVSVRVATVRGDQTPCVAFDVAASAEERAAFFGRVDSPSDRRSHGGDLVFAAFDINPPNPKQTVARLLSLRASSEA